MTEPKQQAEDYRRSSAISLEPFINRTLGALVTDPSMTDSVFRAKLVG